MSKDEIIVNEKNADYLAYQCRKIGLPDDVIETFKEKAKLGLFKEQIEVPKPLKRGDIVGTVVPVFSQSQDPEYKDRFNLNVVKANFKLPDGEKLQVKFPMYRMNEFTLEQMFDMVENLSPVYKKNKDEKMGRWAVIDKSAAVDDDGYIKPRIYTDENNPSFRLERHIDKLPYKWADGEKDNVADDLKNGKAYTSKFRVEGTMQEITIKVGRQIDGLEVLNAKGEVIKRTNESNFKVLVAEEVPGKDAKEDLKAQAQALATSEAEHQQKQGKGQKAK